MDNSAGQTSSGINNHTLPDAFEEFLDRIIAEKGFPQDSLPQDFIPQAKADLRPLLLKAINLAQYAALLPEKQEEFKSLLGNNTPPQELSIYFETHLKNQQFVIAQALIDFRNKYLGQT